VGGKTKQNNSDLTENQMEETKFGHEQIVWKDELVLIKNDIDHSSNEHESFSNLFSEFNGALKETREAFSKSADKINALCEEEIPCDFLLASVQLEKAKCLKNELEMKNGQLELCQAVIFAIFI